MRLDLLIESDGDSVTETGMTLQFDGPADVVFFQDLVDEHVPDDVDIDDRCTPQRSARSQWASGAGAPDA